MILELMIIFFRNIMIKISEKSEKKYFVLVLILGSFLGAGANYLHEEVHKRRGLNICLPLEVARGVCRHRQDVVFELSDTQYTLCASEYYKTISASSHTSAENMKLL